MLNFNGKMLQALIWGCLLFLGMPCGALEKEVYANAKSRAIYSEYCAGCHSYCPPYESAPPVCIISDRYHQFFGSKDSGLAFMEKFLRDPKPENARLYGAVTQFGEMAPIPLEERELELISQWYWHSGEKRQLPQLIAVSVDSAGPASYRFNFPTNHPAELYILDGQGTELAGLKNNPGNSTILFEGKDASGNPLEEGMYEFYVRQNGLDSLGGFIFERRKAIPGIESVLKRGEIVYKTSCRICHTYDSPAKPSAPSLVEISRQYRSAFSTLEQAQSHIADFIKEPDTNKTRLSEDLLAKYTLMSPVKRSDRDLNAVAAYVWMAAERPAALTFKRLKAFRVKAGSAKISSGRFTGVYFNSITSGKSGRYTADGKLILRDFLPVPE